MLPPRHEVLHAPVGRLGDDIIRWTPKPGFGVRDSGFGPLSKGVPLRKKLFPAPKVQLDPLPYRKEAVDLGVAGGTEGY